MLSRTVGYQFTRVGDARRTPAARSAGGGDRLVPSPVFLLASVRSGSTLLRVILDSHTQIHSPHELHLRVLRVRIKERFGRVAMKQLGLDARGLEHLLWDRVLHRQLVRSGKRIIVDKTPNNVFMWQRLPKAWPKARYLFLLRHPAAIADSLHRATEAPVTERVVARVVEYCTALEEARRNLPGLTVKYEDLVADPQRVTKEVCAFLDVPWEAAMLDYGSVEHGPYVQLIGDWHDKIQSGRIHSELALPAAADVPAELVEISRVWGYL